MTSEQDILKAIGKSLQSARKLRKLTQQQLADRASVSRFTISSIEKGHSSNTANFAKVIWALSLEDIFIEAIAPEKDLIGKSLAFGSLPSRVRHKKESDEFNGEFE
ncbi:MAG: hypothetical protein ISEC1_P2076 [Thiomicrorhabdus sp.]|nr:MAG: hypothetical protein ISEC1_P2076 [Thiomicrorhabdus sp.]